MKIFTGKVLQTKMDKTLTVVVTRVVVHKLYGKRFKRSKKYQVHDEGGHSVGDTVRFTATRPYSKTIKWATIPERETSKKEAQKK